jgi:RNA polymerase sigma-70 factor (ECF subfamily)
VSSKAARSDEAHARMVDERDSIAPPETRRATLVAAVFARFERSLLRYLRELLSRREDAEDVAQETYLRLLRAPRLEPSVMRVRAFMFKVATNLAYDRFRQRRSRGQHDDEPLAALLDESSMPERIVALEQGIALVERTLLELPVRCRQVFLLRVSAEWSYEAIAERLGVSKRTVEREMQQALDACQRVLRGGGLS